MEQHLVPFLILWPACSLFSQHPHSRHGSRVSPWQILPVNTTFFVKEPSQTQPAILPSNWAPSSPVFIQSWYITLRIWHIPAGRAPAQTDVHTVERRDSGPHAGEPGSSRVSVCPHQMRIKLHLQLGESVLTGLLKRIRKGRKTKYWVWGLPHVECRIKQKSY